MPTTLRPLNRWINKQVDSDGAGPQPAETTRYEYDGNQIVLEIDESDSITHRYVWGPAIDQILADERVGRDDLYPLADHLGTVRDLLDSAGNVANHIVYDAFGNVTSETNAAVDHLFGYTGRPFDEATELQNNLNRWYDAGIGQWASEDPIGFAAGDGNLFRYVGNTPTVNVDPTGYLSWRRKVSIGMAFGGGVGQGGLGFGQMVWNDIRPVAGEMAALVTLEMYHFGGLAAERLTGGYATLPGHEAAWQTAQNIADSSAFIRQTQDFIDTFNAMTPRQRLSFVASMPGAMMLAANASMVDWFSELYSKIGKGCYEEAAHQIGKVLGREGLEALAGFKAAKGATGLLDDVWIAGRDGRSGVRLSILIRARP